MTLMWIRAFRAAQLDATVYEELEADANPAVMLEAMAIVALSSLAAGIGILVHGWRDMAVLAITALLGWLVWAVLTFFIGAHLLPSRETQASLGQLLRTTGFSATPGFLRVFGFLPIVGWLVFLIANLWMLAAFVMAVKQALDYPSWGRALAVCLLGWLVYSFFFWFFVAELM